MTLNPLKESETQLNANKAVAHSGALAVIDAASNMRNMQTLSATAAGRVLSNFIESGDLKDLDALKPVNELAADSQDQFLGLYQVITGKKG